MFEQKRRRQVRLNILLMLYFFPLVVMLPLFVDFITYRDLVSAVWLLPFLIPAVGIILAVAWNWRCPACGVLLGLSLRVKRCPSCRAAWDKAAPARDYY